APSQNVRLRLVMALERAAGDFAEAARSLRTMPEIDLPTVIFALVALFVAWKLRSVLGMRQDSERPGELTAPLRRVPSASNPPLAQPDAAPPAPVSQLPADRWKGVAEANPGVWSGLDAIASADRSFSPEAFLS